MSMPTLDYRNPETRADIAPSVVLLWVLPAAAGLFAFASAANWVNEPFGTVKFVDVFLFFGAPIVAMGTGVTWYFIARHRRLPWLVFVLVLPWFVWTLFWSIDSLCPYFWEIWNFM